MVGFTTKALHGIRNKKDLHGSLRVPVYETVTFEHEDSRSIQLTFEGKKPAHAYSRISNPTVDHFEQTIRVLSGGMAVLAVSSGMAAISNTILALGGAGKNVVTSKYLFGNTLSLFQKTLASWGLSVRYVAMTDLAEIDRAIDANTCAVFLESITNPQLEVADCAKISKITKSHGVPLVLDNTLMTPYLFNSKAVGVDIEVLSSTKYISGGGTTVGGLIIDNGIFDWKQSEKFAEKAGKFGPMAFIGSLRQEIYRDVGSCLSPHNAYMQSLGLETMALRIDKSCQNSMQIAEYLDKHPKVKSVQYPGLVGAESLPVAKTQFNGKFGGLLTFDLDSVEQCYTLMDQLEIIRRATNVNDNKTLVIHPFSTIFSEYSAAEKKDMGIRPTMIRLAIGIEDVDDLLNDLEKGLELL